MTNLLVEFKDNILTAGRLERKDYINACNSVFTEVRVSTILHRPPQLFACFIVHPITLVDGTLY